MRVPRMDLVGSSLNRRVKEQISAQWFSRGARLVTLEEQSVYREADKVCDHRNRPNDDGRECQTTPGVLCSILPNKTAAAPNTIANPLQKSGPANNRPMMPQTRLATAGRLDLAARGTTTKKSAAAITSSTTTIIGRALSWSGCTGGSTTLRMATNTATIVLTTPQLAISLFTLRLPTSLVHNTSTSINSTCGSCPL